AASIARGCSAREGTPDVKPAATTAAGFDVPACGLDDVLDDRQAEAGPAGGAGAIGAEEALEEARNVLVGNTGAVFGELEHDLPPGAGQGARAGRPLAGVPQLVLEQVLDDEPEHPAADRHLERLV